LASACACGSPVLPSGRSGISQPWAAKRDAQFVDVGRRHLRYPAHMDVRCGHDEPRRISEEKRAACRLPPWAALVAPGVVLNKDGSFQRTARFRGPDLDSATPAELVGTTARLNNALRRLGSGWALFVEAQRHPATDYPESLFPESASAARRRAPRAIRGSGVLFESSYFLTFACCRRLKKPRAWKPGSMRAASTAAPIRGNC
jgi:hypothetical protein